MIYEEEQRLQAEVFVQCFRGRYFLVSNVSPIITHAIFLKDGLLLVRVKRRMAAAVILARRNHEHRISLTAKENASDNPQDRLIVPCPSSVS